MEGKVMNTINTISSKKTVKMILRHGKPVKGLRHWVLNQLIMVMMALFMMAIMAPLSASPRGEKIIRSSTCHHKVITRTVPVLITKKNNPVMKKHTKQARSRKYSFPV
ncbi:MAG: hypothetical protein Q8868_15620 [Bacteroidota bacterium]|nr:hypothetical protein [Bacteroidota bacterium]